MTKNVKVARFSVSLPSNLVKEMDRAWRIMGYENRSKAIHNALRSFITEFEWMQQEKGQITGAVLVLHYLDKPGLLDAIIGIQHKHETVIPSTMHIHLKENKCLEIIAVKGTIQKVKKLAQDLMKKKGVKQVKVAFIAP